MILGFIVASVWGFGAVAFGRFLVRAHRDDPRMNEATLVVNAALWPYHMFRFLVGRAQPSDRFVAWGYLRMLRAVRIALIVGALASMAVIWRDVASRLNIPGLHIALAPRRVVVDVPGLEQRAIEGPAAVTDYYQAGYAWAQAWGRGSAQCPQDNRAYRDGCRAYFASRQGQHDDGREPAS